LGTGKENGYVAGPYVDASYEKPNSLYLRFSFDGKWTTGGPRIVIPEFDALDLHITEYLTSFHIGYFNLSCNDLYSITPYTGIGYQSSVFHLLEPPAEVIIKFQQLYIPFGLEFLYYTQFGFSLGLKAEYRPGALSKGKALNIKHNDPIEIQSTSVKLEYSQGIRAAVPFQFHLLQESCIGLNLNLTPYIDWNIFGKARNDSSSENVKFKRWYAGVIGSIGINF